MQCLIQNSMPTILIGILLGLYINVLVAGSFTDKLPSLSDIKNPSIRDKIILTIFQNYKHHERPAEETSEPTIVTVNMHILAIHSVDVLNMAYNVDFYLRQEWVDPRLAWYLNDNFKNFTNPISISWMANKLWSPDLFFRNSKEGFRYKMTMPNFLLRLASTGDILYSQKITMKFACQMHLSNFPMDNQQCEINIGSYGYTLDDLKFRWKTNHSVTQANDMQISEFSTPIGVRTLDCTENSKTSTGSYSCLKLLFLFQRQLSCYLVSTFIPAMLIVMVSWLSFWISIDAVPARVTLGLLTLLGILTQNKGVSGNLPRVSYIKAIDIYIIACILFIIGAFTEFAIASNLNRRRLVWFLKKNSTKPIRQKRYTNGLRNNKRVTFDCEPVRDSKMRKLKNCFSFKPKLKANVGQTCTILTLDTRPIKSKLTSARRSGTVLRHFAGPENEVLSRLLPNNSSDNLAVSNDNGIVNDYLPIFNDYHNNYYSNGSMDNCFDDDMERKTIDDMKKHEEALKELKSHDSDLDLYCRILFPGLFLLYNCFYWVYYLILV